jgi:hypothetical protein
LSETGADDTRLRLSSCRIHSAFWLGLVLAGNGCTAFGNRVSAMTETRRQWWLWPLLLLLLPLVVVAGVVWLVAAVLLQLVVWLTWCSRGRHVLVVYSDSPIWQEYFEQNVLPAVGSRGVVLNWSDPKAVVVFASGSSVQIFRRDPRVQPIGNCFSATGVASPIPFLRSV